MPSRLCTAAEIKFYFGSFMKKSKERKSTNILEPNSNCNMTSWVEGCEPGWACSTGDLQAEFKNMHDIPSRTEDCQPCCEGFFCPMGLTCMMRKYVKCFSRRC